MFEMRAILIAVVALGATVQVQAAPLVPAANDPLLAMEGEFAIGNGEYHHIVVAGAHGYRLCNRVSPEQVAVTVVHDGASATLRPGQCEDFHAANLRIEPAARLGEDVVLLGRVREPA
ncbi:MAG: hypothetical protein IT495_14235 [Gammaproteobacteria bacterium]|nr:hypothetical protein [Gammaproteobacteria bacterium]